MTSTFGFVSPIRGMIAAIILLGIVAVSSLLGQRVAIQCTRGADCVIRSKTLLFGTTTRHLAIADIDDVVLGRSSSSMSIAGKSRTTITTEDVVFILKSGERVEANDYSVFDMVSSVKHDAEEKLHAFLTSSAESAVAVEFGGYSSAFLAAALFCSLAWFGMSLLVVSRVMITTDRGDVVVTRDDGFPVRMIGDLARIPVGAALEVDRVRRRVRARVDDQPRIDVSVPATNLAQFDAVVKELQRRLDASDVVERV